MNQELVERIYRAPGRATRAIVDLDAIAGNVSAVRKHVAAETAIMAVVKANGYGHGAIAVAKAALSAGAASLAVATVEEGAQLRRANAEAPILVMGPIDRSEIAHAIEQTLDLAVGELEMAVAVADSAMACASETPVNIHLKVDTGMHRFGSTPNEVADIVSYVARHPALRLRGVFTHFARADERDLAPTREQEQTFASVLRTLDSRGMLPEWIHSANSAATLRAITGGGHNLVRLGIALYGLSPSNEVALLPGMRPAMTIASRVGRVHSLCAGDAVSYGATYRAHADELVALVPIGYADGYRRAFSNRGQVLIEGSVCPVRGRVCMDQTIVGLPAASKTKTGDLVIVGGAWSGADAPSFGRMAEWASTINYEIATGISARVPRWYLRNGEVIAVEDLSGYRSIV